MTLVLGWEDVSKIASMDLAIEAMEQAYGLAAEGRVSNPHRFDITLQKGWLRLMVVEAEGLGVFGYKAMNLFPGVGVRYAVHLYDITSGQLLAIVDARQITALRTAACSAVATKRLAPPQVRRTAIIGTGAEARSQLLAMEIVRPAQTIGVHSRSDENRDRFIEEMTPLVAGKLENCSSVDEAVYGAELVVLATKSAEMVISADQLGAFVHVNSVGSARLDQHELDPQIFAGASMIVCDSVDLVCREAGDAAAALKQGLFNPDTALSLADLVGNGTAGERSGLTLFKSVGSALQDLALAARVVEAATRDAMGWELGSFPSVK